MSLAQRKRWANRPSKERKRKLRAPKVPHIVQTDGKRALCEVPRRTGLLCNSLATYPDGKCCVHTSCLSGTHHERKKLDTKGNRLKAWNAKE
jgi:hypothetical protein